MLRLLILAILLPFGCLFVIRFRHTPIVFRRVFLYNRDIPDMEVDELKAELDLRKVDYADCISRKELADRLKLSREAGRADPRIFDKFNELQSADAAPAFSDEVLEDSTAADGGLPGGLPPQVMQLLAKDREVIAMLKDPKMQDIMKAVMTGGPEGLKKYLGDPDAMVLLKKLGETLARVMQNPQ